MAPSRLKDIVTGFYQSRSPSSSDAKPHLENFHHFTTPTLPHLLALLTQPSDSFPPSGTGLIVVDSVSTLFTLAFPGSKESKDREQTLVKKGDPAQRALGRRWAVMGDFISKIGKLAATKNIAILLTNQTTTRIRSEIGAMLHPAISGTVWDSGISARVVLFRDWMFKTTDLSSSQGDITSGARFAGVIKAKGISYEGIGCFSAFRINKVICFHIVGAKGLKLPPGRALRASYGSSEYHAQCITRGTRHIFEAEARRGRR